jgi:hypothetical protein
MTENDVLRQLLNLKGRAPVPRTKDPTHDDWVTKGVALSAGSELRARYKGQTHLARVDAGALLLNGERFESPSAAAMHITHSPVNGWTFWEYRTPGHQRWQVLKSLRQSADE